MAKPKQAARPFEFIACYPLIEILDVVVRDEGQLLEAIETVPEGSIYLHTHGSFMRRQYIADPYPNDFASWCAVQVRDRVLGEKLGIVDPWLYMSLETLRNALVEIIDHHLAELPQIPSVVYGEPFYFMQAELIEIPLGRQARTLKEFVEIVREVDYSSLYYHTFDAMMRKQKWDGDFALWIRQELEMEGLADQIAKLNPYVMTLQEMRLKILQLCEKALEED